MNFAPVLLGKPKEDFLLDLLNKPQSVWHETVAEQVPSALRDAVAHLADEFTATYLLDCMLLEKGIRNRLPAHGFDASSELLSTEERSERFGDLLKLWIEGCSTVVDERLFADVVVRRPEEFAAIRKHFRRVPLHR